MSAKVVGLGEDGRAPEVELDDCVVVRRCATVREDCDGVRKEWALPTASATWSYCRG